MRRCDMEQSVKQAMAHSVEEFKLPKYDEIPDVGLYLEQTTKYISEFLKPMENISITLEVSSFCFVVCPLPQPLAPAVSDLWSYFCLF